MPSFAQFPRSVHSDYHVRSPIAPFWRRSHTLNPLNPSIASAISTARRFTLTCAANLVSSVPYAPSQCTPNVGYLG